MQVPFRRVFSVAGVVTTLFGMSVSPKPCEAGLIPWTYNAVFGYGPAFPNRGGYAYGGYAPSYPTTVGYGPTYSSSFYGPDEYGWGGYSGAFSNSVGYGYGSYGNCNSCDPCGGSACDPCGSCNNCASGNCNDGNCGAGYTPPGDNRPVPEPTPTQPQRTTPPAANPPTYKNDPPPDDFRRVPNRNNDARPQIPNTPMPNDSFTPRTNSPSGFEDPARSSIPGGQPSTIPTTPNSGINPNVNPSVNPGAPGTIPPITPGGNAPGYEGPGNALKIQGSPRDPAPMEPAPAAKQSTVPPVKPIESNPDAATPEPLPFNPGASMRPVPIDTQVDLVVDLQIRRQRVIIHAAEVTHSVARLPVAPATPAVATPEVLAKK